MSRQQKYDGPRPATLQEQRAGGPERSPHRSRKDTKRWCRGKVGLGHDTAPELDSWATYRRTVNPKAVVCQWNRAFSWLAGQNVGSWVWSCSHIEVCRNCGKHVRGVGGADCPDWRPLTTE